MSFTNQELGLEWLARARNAYQAGHKAKALEHLYNLQELYRSSFNPIPRVLILTIHAVQEELDGWEKPKNDGWEKPK